MTKATELREFASLLTVASGQIQFDTDIKISGDLITTGNTINITADTLNISDPNITLASGAANSAIADGAGITIDGANATLIYTHDVTNPGWSVNKAFGIGVTTPEKPFHVKDSINQVAIFESTDGRTSIELRDSVDSGFLVTEDNMSEPLSIEPFIDIESQ